MQRGKDFAQARKLEPFGFGRAPVADQNGADGVGAKHQRRPSEHCETRERQPRRNLEASLRGASELQHLGRPRVSIACLLNTSHNRAMLKRRRRPSRSA